MTKVTWHCECDGVILDESGVACRTERCGAMSEQGRRYLRFGAVMAVIVVALGYLAYTGVQDSKSYYVTIKELNGMGNGAYSKRLRVAGNVAAGIDQAPGHPPGVPAGGAGPHPAGGLQRHAKLRPTPSRTTRRRWRRASSDATASSTPPTFRPSAPPSMLPNSRVNRARRRPAEGPQQNGRIDGSEPSRDGPVSSLPRQFHGTAHRWQVPAILTLRLSSSSKIW